MSIYGYIRNHIRRPKAVNIFSISINHQKIIIKMDAFDIIDEISLNIMDTLDCLTQCKSNLRHSDDCFHLWRCTDVKDYLWSRTDTNYDRGRSSSLQVSIGFKPILTSDQLLKCPLMNNLCSRRWINCNLLTWIVGWISQKMFLGLWSCLRNPLKWHFARWYFQNWTSSASLSKSVKNHLSQLPTSIVRPFECCRFSYVKTQTGLWDKN